jgi:plasmid stabilization system protein ParE
VDVELHEEARTELVAATSWYALRDARTAARFVAEYERVEALIGANPERWPLYTHSTHRILMRGFPYAVIYRVDPTRVLITAVAHQHQRPGYWAQRLG